MGSLNDMAAGSTNTTTSEAPSTEFQVHINHLAKRPESNMSNVIDFTEKRLIDIAKKTASPRIKSKIITLLQSYQAGQVMVAWTQGKPKYHKAETGVGSSKANDI